MQYHAEPVISLFLKKVMLHTRYGIFPLFSRKYHVQHNQEIDQPSPNEAISPPWSPNTVKETLVGILFARLKNINSRSLKTTIMASSLSSSNNPMEWIIEHLACTDNYDLLQSLPIHMRGHHDDDDDDIDDADELHLPFAAKTEKLLSISKLKSMISTTSPSRIHQLQHSNIIREYHSLYPDHRIDVQSLRDKTASERDDFLKWMARLFECELQLKMQIVICAQYWRNDYVQHKQLNDALLHPQKYHIVHNRYVPPHSSSSSSDAVIPRADIVQYVCAQANGIKFIRCCHNQLDFLGQQCTNPSLNLQDMRNSTVQKIHQFLEQHSFPAFRDKFMQTMDVAQNRLCAQGKDFLSRISKADLCKILRGELPQTPSLDRGRSRVASRTRSRARSDPQHETINLISTSSSTPQHGKHTEAVQQAQKFALRNVVDVKIKDNWSGGTVIKCYSDGSLKIALHKEAPDKHGNYQYDTHLTIRNLNDVIHCITEDGEYEMDRNPQLLVDESSNQSQFSSPITQQQIRKQKRRHADTAQSTSSPVRSGQEFQQLLANRNLNRRKKQNNEQDYVYPVHEESDTGYERDKEESVDHQQQARKVLDEHTIPSQSTDITEPTLSNQLSPSTVRRTRSERVQQFQIRSRSETQSVAAASSSKSPSRPRSKRSREEYEQEQQRQPQDVSPANMTATTEQTNNKKKKASPTAKRRKVHQTVERTIVTRSVAKAAQQKEQEQKQKQQQQQQQQKQTNERRHSPRLAERRRESLRKQQQRQQQIEQKRKERQMEEQKSKKKKKKKKKVQTTITGTKDKTMTYTKSQHKKKRKRDRGREHKHDDNHNRKERRKEQQDEVVEIDEGSEGEEIEWSDMSDDAMKKLAKETKETRAARDSKKKKGKRTEEAEEALKACYAKHNLIRRRVNQYHLWEQIKRDTEYCKHWPDRTAVSIRDKARSLLGLDKKTEKTKKSHSRK